MIGPDHEIGNGGAWETAMHRHQQRFHNLAAGQQRRARALINEAGKGGWRRGRDGGLPPPNPCEARLLCFCAPEPLLGEIALPLNGNCDEEELAAGMMELHFHVQKILSEKRLSHKEAA